MRKRKLVKDNPTYSKNERAEIIVGFRGNKGHIDGIIFNQPCELGYRCPVCKNEPYSEEHGICDERLEWSEYNGFLYCSVCNKDYPSALCQPDIDKAIKIYLDCIKDANEIYQRCNRKNKTKRENGIIQMPVL